MYLLSHQPHQHDVHCTPGNTTMCTAHGLKHRQRAICPYLVVPEMPCVASMMWVTRCVILTA